MFNLTLRHSFILLRSGVASFAPARIRSNMRNLRAREPLRPALQVHRAPVYEFQIIIITLILLSALMRKHACLDSRRATVNSRFYTTTTRALR